MTTTITTPELDFNAKEGARIAKERAQDAADAADRKTDGEWSGLARTALIDYLKFIGDAGFMAEDLRKYAYEVKKIPMPPEERAWGAIINWARQIGLIKVAGYGKAKDKKVHGSITTIWKRNLPL